MMLPIGCMQKNHRSSYKLLKTSFN